MCTAQGDVSWFINGLWLSYGYEDDLEDIGFTFSETRVSGTTYPTTNMTMTVPATNTLNRTEIQCKTVGSDGIQVSSDVAWLWIAGTVQHCIEYHSRNKLPVNKLTNESQKADTHVTVI